MPLPPRLDTRKKPWSRPLADLIGKAIDPVLAKQGFGESAVILHWDDIVGQRLAAATRPIQLQWPPRPAGRRDDTQPQAATLVIRVESGFAIELQHMTDQVLARINAHLGWRCVGRLALKQGPIERAGVATTRRPPPGPEALAKAAALVGAIEEDGLRAALVKLAAQVTARGAAEAG